MAEPSSWLRRQPRQQRSVDRVEALLDAAEAVFRELGFDNATTNMIAERADIPVASLYRWFDDKEALAEGLATRYLTRLGATYEALIASGPAPTTAIRDGIRELGRVVAENPGLPAVIRTAATSPTGSLLRDTLRAAVVTIIRTRVPAVDDDDLERISQMATTVAISVLADTIGPDSAAFDTAVDELADLVIAWLSARFPPSDDPVWDMESPLIRPLSPSLGDRVVPGSEGIGGHGR